MRRTALVRPALDRLMDLVPGKQRFGLYRFLPLFFLLGAGLEFSMINWTVGETNFYRTFMKRQALERLELRKQKGSSDS